MKTYLECVACKFKQLIMAARVSGLKDEEIRPLLIRLGKELENVDFELTPAQNAAVVYEILREKTGIKDPYREIKKKSIEEALRLYPRLKGLVEDSGDRIQMALKIAAVGNTIDFGVPHHFDIEEEINKIVHTEFAIFDYEAFKKVLDKAEWVLILGDNAGESVFDRVLIEELRTMGRDVVYAVRGGPVINDLTIEEAVESGIDGIAKIVSTGMRIPSTVPGMVTEEFKRLLEDAPLIISKGQGNFEGMSDSELPIFFLLKAKCQPVADELGVKLGDLVLKGGKSVA